MVESRSPQFPVGSKVFGEFGWRTYTIYNPKKPLNFLINEIPYILPDFGNLPVSLGLGYLGMPGNAASFGFLEICMPKEGETVVISTAAGAVGSLVGQIAKLKGCYVIGFAGSDEKCKWLESELGFDKAINYKTENVSVALKKAAPKGVDCYFDNVGGALSSTVMEQMNRFGRISVCGSITNYNSEEDIKVPAPQMNFIFNQLKMEGFICARWMDKWTEGIFRNLKWIQEGKIKYRETITEGFENQPQAFIDMLSGKSVGKAVVKVLSCD